MAVVMRSDGGRKRSSRYQPCRVCGEPRPTSRASAAEITCRKCRREQRDQRDAYLAAELADTSRQAVAFNLGSTTRRGLGRHHRSAVADLKRNHVDGSPCEWCGRPMWLNPAANYDGNKLQGDHRIARSVSRDPTRPPDRLLHAECNRQRGNGANDHLAWVNHRSDCNTTSFATEDGA